MRNRLFSIVAGLALVALSASSTLAATDGGGGSDLGLDAVQITGGSVVSKTGVVTLTGSVSCSQDVEVFVSAELTQVVGRFNTIRSWGSPQTSVVCLAADRTASFSFSIVPDNGKFAAGKAVVSAYAEADVCDDLGCSTDIAMYGPVGLALKGGKG